MVISMILSKSALLHQVDDCLKQIKRQQALLRMLKSCIFGILISAFVVALYIGVWTNASEKIRGLAELMTNWSWPMTFLIPILGLWLVLSLVLSIVCFIYLRQCDSKLRETSTVTALTPNNFLMHVNRQHPSLEESAHLLAMHDNALSVQQTLQLKRILPSLADIINSAEKSWQPTASFQYLIRKNIYALLFALVLLSGAILLTTNAESPIAASPDKVFTSAVEADTNYLEKVVVSVSPPIYTQQAPFKQSTLNINVLQGSLIEWLIPIDQDARLDGAFTLSSSGTELVSFVNNGYAYSAKMNADMGAVYSISQSTKTSSFTSDIATVTVQRDSAPRITFKAPILTITEIFKNIVPSIKAVVEISDDYGITDVKIVASIAKGSGEAVKFRDQEFLFDSVQADDTFALYTKNWDLRALDMEPGDELYFSVHASDNKMPSVQKTVSPIKIIRWLEDEEASISGEGIVIDFMPEYFKSQQQIIIETVTLIEQLQSLSDAEISGISRGLGIAQSDLKQSYGQYLGDEFESGVMQNMEAGVAMPDIDDHSNEHSGEHSESDESEHSAQGHEHDDDTYDSKDISGYQQVIEQFGHNHGEADIGFIKTSQGQINPKVLMKSAIAAMWQAELHLQLSQPKLALPYEKEALNYLNRAKQAERIYVKRLGFEPPPVTEERRYTGKLKDILSYQRDTQIALTSDQNSQYVALVVLVNNYLTLAENTLKTNKILTPEARDIIDKMVIHLTNKLASEPEWISQLATLKRIQMANSLRIQDCLNCLQSLLSELSRQILAPIAQPYFQEKTYSTKHPAVRAYADALLNNNNKLTNSEIHVKQGNEL